MKWLTGRGVAAALGVGLATGYGLGWRGLLLLLGFFVSSSLLSNKTSRNHRQVIANGGIAALSALLGSWLAFAGALAAATADTWATEIGRFSPTPPRLITTGARVPAGTDGGMTLLGTVGGIAGAGLIAGLAVGLGPGGSGLGLAMRVAVAGIIGMVLDSLLGATVQGKVRWVDNDAVNLAATLTGAVCAGLIA
ncbi:MAG TPA: DUF92 domain-containing protein [Gemmatimonadales bacterium]|nr:DUF92 domain-containing protein [Gemmatimonadales bacterium]